jgi:DNA-binding CsgD family transcriptional regulator
VDPGIPRHELVLHGFMMGDWFRSGDALFAFDAHLVVRTWNAEAARLTGIPAEEAIGRTCWDLLGGVDERGALICHAGCSSARLARDGWPVPCRRLTIRTATGRTRVSLSTIAVHPGDGEPLTLHLLRNGDSVEEPRPPQPRRLTPRQHEVLTLLADGLPAKVIAARLGLSPVTVRNHIQAILTELRCHSQLEAVAAARRSGLL